MDKSITKDWTQPVRRQGKASEIVMRQLGILLGLMVQSGQGQCVGPLTRTVILIWGSSCRTNGNKKDATLVDGGASISPEELGRKCLDYIMRDGWIDIAGQCANTISVRNGGCGM